MSYLTNSENEIELKILNKKLKELEGKDVKK